MCTAGENCELLREQSDSIITRQIDCGTGRPHLPSSLVTLLDGPVLPVVSLLQVNPSIG